MGAARGVQWQPAAAHSQLPGEHTYASFEDPDSNSWLLQEITERLPGQ